MTYYLIFVPIGLLAMMILTLFTALMVSNEGEISIDRKSIFFKLRTFIFIPLGLVFAIKRGYSSKNYFQRVMPEARDLCESETNLCKLFWSHVISFFLLLPLALVVGAVALALFVVVGPPVAVGWAVVVGIMRFGPWIFGVAILIMQKVDAALDAMTRNMFNKKIQSFTEMEDEKLRRLFCNSIVANIGINKRKKRGDWKYSKKSYREFVKLLKNKKLSYDFTDILINSARKDGFEYHGITTAIYSSCRTHYGDDFISAEMLSDLKNHWSDDNEKHFKHLKKFFKTINIFEVVDAYISADDVYVTHKEEAKRIRSAKWDMIVKWYKKWLCPSIKFD